MGKLTPDHCCIPGCGDPHYGRGYCNKHYQAARSRGLLPPKTTEERYEEKIDRSDPDGCHPWVGSVSRNGQAKFSHDGETLATRWGYKRFVGPLVLGELVRHKCDNAVCCNPDHWVKGSYADNSRDCVERGRTAKGEKSARAALTAAQVRDMRQRYGAHRALSYPEIGRQYGVGPSGVRSILIGRTWRHVA